MKNYKVRDYLPENYNDLMNLWLLTDMGGAERGDNDEIIAKSIEIGGRMLLMFSDNSNELIGSSWMTFDGRRVHMHHFAIHPYYQGLGLARELLKASLKHVREKGYQVKLEVNKDNIKAINLYTKAGFKYLGDYDVYIIREV